MSFGEEVVTKEYKPEAVIQVQLKSILLKTLLEQKTFLLLPDLMEDVDC